MNYLSIFCLLTSLARGGVSSEEASPRAAGARLQSGAAWYTVTSAGTIRDNAGPYALSGCISQSPVSVPVFTDGGDFYIIAGFWSSEFSASPGSDREEVRVASLPPRQLKFYGNHPNPFRHQTRITYDLPAAGNVSLSVYDAAGRQLRELVNGQQAPGRYDLPWDGKDKAGAECPSGIYFCALTTDDQRAVRKMLITE